MKKNILIIILSIFVAFFWVYSYIKASEAEKNLIQAQKYLEVSQTAQQEAENQAELAREQVELAQREAERAATELLECQSK